MTTQTPAVDPMKAYAENRKRVAAARRAFRDAARAVVAEAPAMRDYDDFAAMVNAKIAQERSAIDTTAVRA